MASGQYLRQRGCTWFFRLRWPAALARDNGQRGSSGKLHWLYRDGEDVSLACRRAFDHSIRVGLDDARYPAKHKARRPY